VKIGPVVSAENILIKIALSVHVVVWRISSNISGCTRPIFAIFLPSESALRDSDGSVSTVLFRYYWLGGDTAAPSGLLARLCHAFLVSLFFSVWYNYLQIDWTNFFTIFLPNDRYLYECERFGSFFLIPLGTLPWLPIIWPNLGICIHLAE